jgi:uncharacterized protein YjiS (DUF1127 family)
MFIGLLIARFRTWLLYRHTIHELERLTDRDLSDIGTSRPAIREFAREFVSSDSTAAASAG